MSSNESNSESEEFCDGSVVGESFDNNSETLYGAISIRIVDGEYVFPVQSEMENLALWSGQSMRMIYHEPIWLGNEKKFYLLYDRHSEAGGWRLHHHSELDHVDSKGSTDV